MRHSSRLVTKRARPVWNRRRAGATLIELLVVISLISLLMATLIPSIRRSVQVGAATVCKNNLREIGNSIFMYRLDNDGWMPTAEDIVHSDGSTSQAPWFAKLFPMYLNDPRILECPEDPFGYRIRNADLHFDDPNVSEYASYGANRFAIGIVNGGALDPDRLRPAKPHNTILAADMGPDNIDRQASTAVTAPPRSASMLAWDDGSDPYHPQKQATPWLTTRHNKGIHMLTIAGGVRDVSTYKVLRSPIEPYYARCASGGCTFCKQYRMSHYSFASSQLYWWTGPSPLE